MTIKRNEKLMPKDNFLLHPYSKATQLKVKAGTKEAEALLKRAKPKQNKYRNKKTAVGNETYDSQLEARYGMLLTNEVAEGKIKSFRRQVCLKLRVNNELICKYFIDFVIVHNDGRMELSEIKGVETTAWQNKFKLTKALLPKGEIEGIPRDARLTIVKAGKNGGFIHFPQLLDYRSEE